MISSVAVARSSTKWLLAILVAGALIVPLADAGMIDKDGMADWEICAMCHGANGISAMAKFPVLAGQKARYIVQQFGRFSRAERSNDGGQMQGITTEVELSALPAIADYFAGLAPPEAPTLDTAFLAANADLLARGKQLFYEGSEGVLACASCHADKDSSAPWIDGQHREYVQKQLDDFAAGRRPSGDGNMAEIAANLSAEDRAASALFVWVTRLNRQ